MKTIEVPVTRMGNSRGVKLLASMLRRYEVGKTLLLEERTDAIVLRPKPARPAKLSWEETARAMTKAGEDWSDWESLPDGLGETPWDSGK